MINNTEQPNTAENTPQNTKDRWYTEQTQDLFRAVQSLNSDEECKRFFRDLMTIKELQDISERWQVVNKLNNGESYRSISKETGASTTTIGRVAQWLHFGEGGYQLALQKRNT